MGADRAAPGRHAALEHGPARRRLHGAVRGARRGARVPGRAHRRPAQGPLARPAGRAARRTRLRQQLRLGVARPLGRWGTAARCWSSRSPTTRWSTCRSSPACAASTPRWRSRPGRWGTAAGARSGRWCCPSCGPALLGGMLLVGLHLLAEFGALQLLRFPTFTTAIYDLYGSTFNGAAANMIAGVLVLCCLLLLLARAAAARPPPVRPRRPGRGRGRRCRSGSARRGCPLIAGLAGLVALSVGVPTYALVHWLRVGTSTEFPLGELAAAAGSTVALAAVGRRRDHPRSRCRSRGWRSATAAPCRPPSSAAPTSPTRCPASWSRWPSSRSACGWCRRSTRPRCCSSWRTPCSSCPGPWSRSAPGSSRHRWCSTTSPTASAAARWRPRAG